MKKEHFKYIAQKHNIIYNELWVHRCIELVDVGTLIIIPSSITNMYTIQSNLTLFVGLHKEKAEEVLQEIFATEVLFQ